MNQTAVFTLSRQLAATIRERSALILNGSALTDLEVMRLDKQARVQAADLEAAFAEPQTYSPWTPHSPRNSCPDFKPGSAT